MSFATASSVAVIPHFASRLKSHKHVPDRLTPKLMASFIEHSSESHELDSLPSSSFWCLFPPARLLVSVMGASSSAEPNQEVAVTKAQTEWEAAKGPRKKGKGPRLNGLDENSRRIANAFWESASADDIRQLRVRGVAGTTEMLRHELDVLLQAQPQQGSETEKEWEV